MCVGFITIIHDSQLNFSLHIDTHEPKHDSSTAMGPGSGRASVFQKSSSRLLEVLIALTNVTDLVWATTRFDAPLSRTRRTDWRCSQHRMARVRRWGQCAVLVHQWVFRATVASGNVLLYFSCFDFRVNELESNHNPPTGANRPHPPRTGTLLAPLPLPRASAAQTIITPTVTATPLSAGRTSSHP